MGRRARVLIEGFDEERKQWLGRSAAEAPEVDGNVFVESCVPLLIGTFVDVEITASETYDVVGCPVG